MSRSRWGGFRTGKRALSNWTIRKSPSAVLTQAPATVQDMDYTQAQGIWNLRSTVQFYKKNEAGSYTTGLSDSLDTISGESATWAQRTIDISEYAGATVLPVFYYVIGAVSGSVGYRADLQLDNINLDGTTYTFESGVESFQISTDSTQTVYSSVSWGSLATATTQGVWNRHTGATPSGSTGSTGAYDGSYYVYAEVSGTADNRHMWLRGPQITLSSSPSFTYYERREGIEIGTLNVYLDVIA